MSIFTSVWFWILVIGILLTIGGVIAWAVTGKADILVGILLGAGVGWIIAGLIMWIFGRSKKVPELPPIPEFPPIAGTAPAATTTTAPVTVPQATQPQVPKPVQQPTSLTNSQQQLMQLLQANPQIMNSYTSSMKL